ncbi:abscisic acid receptor PYL12-like [Phoenix dactylifera]|uniref:Abscisic acid receptor PYL12-like n=1 Tax=Phoenix dactylifera TaxID=42345 RepID=A0A8B7C105_PHODC|nr:abscisic acid receptor PYL12-like [Phoenix dactylifera]
MPLLPSSTPLNRMAEEMVDQYHNPEIGRGRCGSFHVQHVAAPAAAVWSLVRRFDRPELYKQFVRTCALRAGDGRAPGSVREVHVVSGLPAETSTERLDKLDDDRRIIRFTIVGGDHRLRNYRSTTTVHDGASAGRAVVVESYTVDVPPGSTEEETCVFVDTIIRCNLRSLARVAEKMTRSLSNG